VRPRPFLLAAAALCAVALTSLPPAADAAPGLLLGVDDDSLKWYAHTSSLISIYRDLGLCAVRVTLTWTPGRRFPAGAEATELQRVGEAGRSIRVVLAVTGPPAEPPRDDASRAAYCGYVASVLARYPWIRDVAIWTEPNSSRFWKPQKDAPAGYEALLATCWDTLHAVRSDVNLIATSAPHADPGRWYRKLGSVYRATLRGRPIFDTVGHNAYPETSEEAPDARHTKGSIDEGDLGRLLAALRHGFAGTSQPLPGNGGVTVWYLEDGFQTTPAHVVYTGVETDKAPISEDEQAAQLTAAVRLAYCQPSVGAFFNFELRDESALDGWQSGLVRADWSAKPSFTAYRDAIEAARADSIRCGAWNGSSSRAMPSRNTAPSGSSTATRRSPSG
jgi:hypothetical protein